MIKYHINLFSISGVLASFIIFFYIRFRKDFHLFFKNELKKYFFNLIKCLILLKSLEMEI